MNALTEEILSHFGDADLVKDENSLMHYGIKRRSGRYPYGSGKDSYQHGRDFLGRIDELKKSGFTYTDSDGKKWTGDNAIAKSMGLTTSEYRRQVSWATYERRLQNVETAKRLRDKEGMGPTEIGKEMGVNESTVRSWLNPKSEDRMEQAMNTVNLLREHVDKKGMIDVGTGVERELGISKERLDMALDYLEKAEGYPVYKGGIPQVTNPGQQTNQRVLCVPGTQHKEIYEYDRVKTITEYTSHDNGQTFDKFVYPKSIDSKRVLVLTKDQIGPDGEPGVAKDGIIQIRPGVEDLSLGESRYAQVRILVDDTKYLKGMAVYSDNIPDGYDIVFNSNKKTVEDAYKKIKDDPDNPFGSLIQPKGQSYYIDKNGKKQLSAINKRADEGEWEEWANAIPSQFLSKQSRTMAKKQLNLAKADKLAEFDEICSLENPTVKKHLLEKFADSCDSAAVHLKAAALPGQRYHVIVPVNTLKDNEVYAPNYENGTKLALIRYPHGGTFEIPILTVNNRHAAAKKLIGPDAIDAVCINHKIAEQLSGADFDGDTVMCIPTHDAGGKVKIVNRQPFDDLKNFDSRSYQYDKAEADADGNMHYYRNGQEFKIMKNTGTEMGKISNLITDMTLSGGATDDEIIRAVRHSMVVIDAEKHKLDYKASEIENDIAGLKSKYQKKYDEDGNVIGSGGAGTLISRAKGETSVDKRQGSYKINIPGTDHYDPTKPDGAKIWKTADDLYYPDRTYNKKDHTITVRTADGKKVTYDVTDKDQYERYNPVKKVNADTGEVTYTNKDGSITYKTKKRTQESTKMAETDDAYTLVSGARHPMEILYADYANDMKALGNKARVELYNTGKIAYSAQAKAKYAEEVSSLNKKLNTALLNTTKERAAQRMANAEVAAKTKGKEIKPADKKKMAQQALTKYRTEVGSVARRNRSIDITDKEWEAIQAGAITENTLKKILNNTDIDVLRQKATPKATTTLSSAKINRIKAMSASNYTLEEIAKALGVPTSTVYGYAKGVKK